jgi:hypothetical protein
MVGPPGFGQLKICYDRFVTILVPRCDTLILADFSSSAPHK